MEASIDRKVIRRRIRHRIRRRVSGTAERPRLAVFRSEKHIYVQAIDDAAGKTLVQTSTLDPEVRARKPHRGIEAAKIVGATMAERLKGRGVETVIFDRGGFRYHGRVRALADAAREAGLKF